MNRWKTSSIVLGVILISLLFTLGVRTLMSFNAMPTAADVDAYVDAAERWVHAEEQMKLSLGEALKVADQAENVSQPDLAEALADLNALLRLDPPSVPTPVAGLNDDGLFDGNFAPLRSEIEKMPVEEAHAQTRQIIEASEKAEERARAVTRRANRVTSLLLSSGH